MTKRLSIVLLMAIAAMYGCAVALDNVAFQMKTYSIDREFAMSTYWISVAVQVISAPFLIRLSDTIGRNAVMMISFAGILIGLASILFADSVMPLSIGYIIVALTGTGSGCFNAYCSDQNPRYRAELFAINMAAWALGYVAANTIREQVYELGENFPVYVGTLIATAAIALILFVLPNSLHDSNRTPFNLREANVIGASGSLFANRAMGMLTIAALLFFLGMRAYSYIQASVLSMYFNARHVAEMQKVQQLSVVLVAITTIALLLFVGKTKTVAFTLLISMVSIVGILYVPPQVQRLVMLLPFAGSIAAAIFTAMLVDRTSPNRYGLVFAGLSGLTIIMELAASMNAKLFEYFKETSPGNVFLCAVIPAMILLASLVVFLSIPKEDRTSGEIA